MGWTTKDQGSMSGSSNSSSPKQPDWLLASGPSSLLLSGYQDSFSGGKHIRTWNWPLTIHTPNPTYIYTTTHVMPSRHVETALLHIHTILLFQNLSVEIGLQPTHKLVYSSPQSGPTHKFLQNTANTLHIPLLCAPDYTHTHTVYGQSVHRTKQWPYTKFHEFSGLISHIWMMAEFLLKPRKVHEEQTNC
jgi:hypothetical protein